jgi:phosphatidylserine decarboxylase
MNKNALPALIVVGVVGYVVYKNQPSSAFALGVKKLFGNLQSAVAAPQAAPQITPQTVQQAAIIGATAASTRPVVTVSPIWSNPDGSFVQIPLLNPNTPDLLAN